MKAIDFLRTRVGQRFLAIFLAVSLVPLAAMGWFAIETSENTLRTQTLAVLRSSSDGAEAQIREFLQKMKEEVTHTAQDPRISRVFHTASAPSSQDADPAELSKLLLFQRQVSADVQEVFLISKSGRMLASSLGQVISDDFSSAEFFMAARTNFFPGEIARDSKTGRPSWIMAAPVHSGESGEILGVVAFRINSRTLSDLATGRRVLAEGADTQSFQLGDTGETYIVNRARFMITESRYVTNSVLRQRVDTLPVRAALEDGKEITADYHDYRGVQVSGASVFLRDLGWVVITEIDFRQAFVVVDHLRKRVLELAGALGLIVCVLAWDSTRRIIHPIQMLSASDRELAAGKEAEALISEDGLPDDELGDVVRSRNARVKSLIAAQQELRQRTAKLREMISELEQVSYNIMHDMRAPLRAMSSFGDLVVDSEADRLSPQGREYLARVKAAALRMDHLICDVLSYNSIVLGDLDIRPVKLDELLRQFIETDIRFYPHKGRIQLSSGFPPVYGNEGALIQCFSHLLDNAIKFLPDGHFPEVHVWGEEKGSWIRIWVADNGVGIPPHLAEKVFGILQPDAGMHLGTGMGLAIVRKAVERMGGRVGVLSEPGKGSRFWIELRVAEAVVSELEPKLV